MCENCVCILVPYYYSFDKHKHNLMIKEKENYKCDICKRTSGFKNKFCFFCDECNFGICLECFIPQNKNEKEKVHEHPLKFNNNIPSLICKICGEGKKEGYKCDCCKMELCNNCYNNLINNLINKKGSISHQHKVLLGLRDKWSCTICKNENKNQICLICKDCNLNYCLNCFFK